MILCVCLNPAVDITYRVGGAVVPGSSHRVLAVTERAGGKGINVARVLGQLDRPARVLTFLGGTSGQTIDSGLRTAGIEATVIDVDEPSRRTVTVVDPLDATVFNEPGPVIDARNWSRLIEAFGRLLDGTTLVVLSGSLPPGVPATGYSDLAELAAARGLPVIVDAEGAPLQQALAAKPYLVKPNLAELQSLLGRELNTLAEITEAGRRLQSLGAQNVVVSLGRDGLVALTEQGDWRAISAQVVTGNPTGAGDALVAALALGTVTGRPWQDRLRDGVSLAAAAVAASVAGEFDPAVRAGLAPGVLIEELEH